MHQIESVAAVSVPIHVDRYENSRYAKNIDFIVVLFIYIIFIRTC